MDKAQKQRIAEVVKNMTGLPKQVLTLRYGLDAPDAPGRSVQAVAYALGISVEQVQQVEAATLRTLK